MPRAAKSTEDKPKQKYYLVVSETPVRIIEAETVEALGTHLEETSRVSGVQYCHVFKGEAATVAKPVIQTVVSFPSGDEATVALDSNRQVSSEDGSLIVGDDGVI